MSKWIVILLALIVGPFIILGFIIKNPIKFWKACKHNWDFIHGRNHE